MTKSNRVLFMALNIILALCLASCGSGELGDASKYNINEANIKYVTMPSEKYVISVLESIDLINEVAPVTEDNDPNGNLNKDGGYYSTVYFSSFLLPLDTKHTVVENGTEGGGAVESYLTEEDAIAREKYLARLSLSGSHVRLGTVVVRISRKLDENNQMKLEEAICNKLLEGENFTSRIDELNEMKDKETVDTENSNETVESKEKEAENKASDADNDVAEKEEESTPKPTATPEIEEPITISNNDDFKKLINIENPSDENQIKTFVNKYKGMDIEFDGCAMYSEDDRIVVWYGDYEGENDYYHDGPEMLLMNVDPNPISTGQNIHILATVKPYNDGSWMMYLDNIYVTPR